MDILIGPALNTELSLRDSMGSSNSLQVEFYGRGSGRGGGRPYVVCDLYGFRVVVTETVGYDDIYGAMWMGPDELEQTVQKWLGRAIATKPEILARWFETLLSRLTH
jgi:hypothetical protein